MLLKGEIIISTILNFSSANAFNMDKSKNLPFGKGLNCKIDSTSLPNNKTSDLHKLKAYADSYWKFVLIRVGNIEEK